MTFNGKQQTISGHGNGPIAGYVEALGQELRHRHQGARLSPACHRRRRSDAQAVSFIEAETADGRVLWGVGMDSNIVTASLKAVTCAANRAVAAR